MDLQEFYELIEKHRLDAIEKLVKKYRTISPLLGKVRCCFVRPSMPQVIALVLGERLVAPSATREPSDILLAVHGLPCVLYALMYCACLTPALPPAVLRFRLPHSCPAGLATGRPAPPNYRSATRLGASMVNHTRQRCLCQSACFSAGTSECVVHSLAVCPSALSWTACCGSTRPKMQTDHRKRLCPHLYC